MRHLEYSTISNLKNNNCDYRVIPVIDKSGIANSVPTHNDNILGCQENSNKSKVCPVVLCNTNRRTPENEKIYNRNFPDVKLVPITGYRSEFKICNVYKNFNDIDAKHKTHKNELVNVTDVENALYPGKAPASIYFNNIDVESNLRTLNLPNSSCQNKKYTTKLCTKIVTDNPRLLERPMCQNYKYSQFKDTSEFHTYTNKCRVTKEKIRGYTCNDQVSDIRQKSLLKFKYDRRKDTPCNTGCLPALGHELDIEQPLLYGNRANMSEKPILQIGPERTDHLVENLWHNVSKRKYIYKKHE